MFSDSGATAFVCRHARMRRCSRTRDEAFYSPEARRRYCQNERRDELLSGVDTSVELEADHPAKSIEQLAGTLMVLMTFEAGIIHRHHSRMSLKKIRQLHRAIVLMANAHGQRFHPSVQKETSVGIKRTAEMAQFSIDLVNEDGAPNDRPSHDVGVAIEIFGAAVERQVEAPFSRAEIDGAGESVVDH